MYIRVNAVVCFGDYSNIRTCSFRFLMWSRFLMTGPNRKKIRSVHRVYFPVNELEGPRTKLTIFLTTVAVHPMTSVESRKKRDFKSKLHLPRRGVGNQSNSPSPHFKDDIVQKSLMQFFFFKTITAYHRQFMLGCGRF